MVNLFEFTMRLDIFGIVFIYAYKYDYLSSSFSSFLNSLVLIGKCF